MTRGVLDCPRCGAPMKLELNRDYAHCSYCDNYYVGDPSKEGVTLLKEESALHCPVCRAVLVEAAIHGTRILACPHCHGNLLHQWAMLPIITAAPPMDSRLGRLNRPADASERSRRLQCPSCSRTMDSYPYAGPGAVIIQGCAACKLVWLDFGELSKIIWANQHAAPPIEDRPGQAEDLLDEMDRLV